MVQDRVSVMSFARSSFLRSGLWWMREIDGASSFWKKDGKKRLVDQTALFRVETDLLFSLCHRRNKQILSIHLKTQLFLRHFTFELTLPTVDKQASPFPRKRKTRIWIRTVEAKCYDIIERRRNLQTIPIQGFWSLAIYSLTSVCASHPEVLASKSHL